MSKLKLKINVNLRQLLCIVVSVTLHSEFERFCGFCVDCFCSNAAINVMPEGGDHGMRWGL